MTLNCFVSMLLCCDVRKTRTRDGQRPSIRIVGNLNPD